MAVSAFNFEWPGVGGRNVSSLNEWPTLSDEHAVFNQAFVRAFPRRSVNQPYSSFTDTKGLGLIATSRLYAIGETVLSPDETRYHVLEIAKASGFFGDESRVRYSQCPIDNWGNCQLFDPGYTVNPIFTSDGNPFKDWLGPSDIPWWAYAAGGGLLLLLLIRD